ncbi:30S ribosomal protein S17 [Halarsenatibacter silvermanii]|uniref:Small ribosomal subunit protein uS17 n=1 Tax=Halarsenatibacter silvermanii TaxID=321763 RepID=A0A1G9NAB4_9FIRM|nr:30S ribosomal protein S17 [Halarsenatibacter silvermanii]SDL83414.1 SSU ribosomal protein S17P [Halarsenatibacter silvermanii]
MAQNSHDRKVEIGEVVSDKMDKTVTVKVIRRKQHDLYKKTIRRGKRFKAHDEENRCREGDTVEITETRPISKTKNWRVTKILEKAK